MTRPQRAPGQGRRALDINAGAYPIILHMTLPRPRRRPCSPAWILLLLASTTLFSPADVRSQEAQVNVEAEVADSLQSPPSTGRPSPGGAFLRSILVPGWGQASSGASSRAAFYFLVQAGNVWMAYKINALRDSARRRQQLLEDAMTAELLRRGIESEALEAELAADPRIEDIRLLTTARDEQMEDTVALLVFFVFFGGADAFVSAHLADFPVPLTVEPVAGPSGTAFEVGVSLPWTPGS